MTLAANDRVNLVSATAGQTILDTDFRVDDKAHLRIRRKRGDALATLLLDVDYAVTNIGLEGGCRATLSTPAVTGDVYLLEGAIPAARTSSFVDRGGVSSLLLDQELDSFQAQIQEVRRDVNRAPRFDGIFGEQNPQLPPPDPGKLLAWGPDGFVNASPATITGPESVPGLVAALAGKQATIGYTPENAANRGAANGYAPLGNDAKVPSSFLPSFVDDVLEFDTLGQFPATGEAGKLYVETTGLRRSFRWGGTSYAEISPSPGSTDQVPEGLVNRYYTQARVLNDLETALGGQLLALSNIRVGTPIFSLAPTPAPGHIRLTEATQAINKAAFPELDRVVASWGYPWGSAATTFNLPPAAGYFPRFAGTSSTIDTGGPRTAGSLQADQNLAHTHGTGTLTVSVAGDHSHAVSPGDVLQRQNGNAGGGTSGTFTNGIFTVPASTGVAGAHTHALSGATGSSGGNEVRVKNVALHLDVVATPAAANADVYGVIGVPYRFDAATAAADPGAGDLRLNSATLSAVTALYISETGATGEPLAPWLASWGTGNRGQIEIYQVGAVGTFLIADVTGVSDSGPFQTVTLSHVASNGSFSAGALLGVQFIRAGRDGASEITVGPVPSNATGNNGDLHIRNSDGQLFKRVAGVWSDQGYSVRGPAGVGDPGPAGAPGASNITVGSLPSNATGADGNLHIRDTDGQLFKRVAGVWTDQGYSVRGPAGPAGSLNLGTLSAEAAPDTVVTGKAGVTTKSTPAEVVAAGASALSSTLAAKLDVAARGAANGVAALDASGLVPASQLPSYVDDIIEYADLAAITAAGAAGQLFTGRIYIALATNRQYRWTGSAVAEIIASPGTTDAVSEGASHLYFTAARVLATALTGLAAGTNAAIAASDTVIAALAKLQAQVAARLPASAVSAFMATLLDDTDAATARETLGVGEVICIACSDETTNLTTGTARVTFRMPFAMTLTSVRASLTTASSSGNPAVDVNENGVSIFSTVLTIDANELTSTTAATPAVLSDTLLANDAQITIDIDAAGTGARGLKVYLIGRRA